MTFRIIISVSGLILIIGTALVFFASWIPEYFYDLAVARNDKSFFKPLPDHGEDPEEEKKGNSRDGLIHSLMKLFSLHPATAQNWQDIICPQKITAKTQSS
ncbi:hypothetical protein K7I13_10445 [Brucepastera parasyntrophica]|uniref:hypothetical protein n=1 Tax=Brucepastera parasyntrophica TaxID=2880008 RepID=UPI002109CBA2|nr:hypothetical protein [Brucepastera parasyntrophica]ULQ58939.1 hypothetical protein K7I13_10445 [Brucepastera parasyntrophica]